MLTSRRCLMVVFWIILIAAQHITAGATEAAGAFYVNAKSALLIDMTDGKILYEQDADKLIPPASLTKIITLYLVFEAIQSGRAHLSDQVPISAHAASMGGSRMHVRAGQWVPLEELISGMAVVSGNDACVAAAEYLAGSVDEFVRRMNRKARELGMDRTHFMNANGLPANGQVTTARDIARLSIAYLRRFPESLSIHSLTSYTFNSITHHNANRLLGSCPGVDGLKTGFVCASGYNISITVKRGNFRLLAVLLGAPSPGVRALEGRRLVEYGYRTVAPEFADIRVVEASPPSRKARTASSSAAASRKKGAVSSRSGANPAMTALMQGSPNEGEDRSCPTNPRTAKNRNSAAAAKSPSAKSTGTSKATPASPAPQPSTTACKVPLPSTGKKAIPTKSTTASQNASSKGAKPSSASEASHKTPSSSAQSTTKPAGADKQKQASPTGTPDKKNSAIPQKPSTPVAEAKAKRG